VGSQLQAVHVRICGRVFLRLWLNLLFYSNGAYNHEYVDLTL